MAFRCDEEHVMMNGPGALRAFAIALAAAVACVPAAGRAQQALALEAKIPLGEVAGRIDHMAIDLGRKHLFVAELGNDTVGVVDIGERRVVHRITGLKEPQGVGYVASTDTLYVANGDDGTVRLFSAADFAAQATIALGSDADNVRVDEAANEVVVGYGRGALAIIDPKRRAKVADIALKAHPEGFRIDPDTHRIYVNVPNAREVAVVDRTAGRQVASWPLHGAASNFPMALDEAGGHVVVVTRSPSKVFVLEPETGGAFAEIETCGDADDVFVQPKRQRIYVSCGSGAVDVIELSEGAYYGIARVPTVSGARTALYVPELDRLFVAVRARGPEPAAIWVFRPIS
jgi:DNA-binding beta-propeller fold protein YncE